MSSQSGKASPVKAVEKNSLPVKEPFKSVTVPHGETVLGIPKEPLTGSTKIGFL